MEGVEMKPVCNGFEVEGTVNSEADPLEIKLTASVEDDAASLGDEIDGSASAVHGGSVVPNGRDSVDPASTTYKIGCITVSYCVYVFVNHVLIGAIALVGHVLDLVSDVVVAVRHYEDDHKWWCGLTLGFLFLPSLLFAMCTLTNVLKRKTSIKEKISWSIGYFLATSVFILLPICRLIHVIKFGMYAIVDQQRRQQYLNEIHRLNDERQMLESVLKAFLENAPQLLLQLYIMMLNPLEDQSIYTVIAQVVSVVISLIALASKVTSLKMRRDAEERRRHARRPKRGKGEEDLVSMAAAAPVRVREQDYRMCCAGMEFIWRFMAISARMLALALFASVFTYWIYPIAFVHVSVVTAFLFLGQSAEKSLRTFVVMLFVGFMYLFCFVEYKVELRGKLGRSRSIWVYLGYYLFTFCQNAPMVVSAYVCAPTRFSFHLPVTILHFAAFFSGVLFMILYQASLRELHMSSMLDAVQRDIAV